MRGASAVCSLQEGSRATIGSMVDDEPAPAEPPTTIFDQLATLQLRQTRLDVYGQPIGACQLFRDPSSGAEHYLIRYPAGLRVQPHRHSAAHTFIVLEGVLEANGQQIGPGSYCHFPAGTVMHHAPAGDEGCLFVAIFDGPQDVIPVTGAAPVGRAIATEPHVVSDRPPLVVRPGSVVTVGRRDDEWPAFVFVEAAEGAGWIPSRYLSADSGRATVTHTYETTELATTAGEVLEILVLDYESGWHWCRAADGRVGWVPTRTLRLAGES